MKRAPIYLPMFLVFAALARDSDDTFNAPAIKVGTQVVSIREVEVLFADSMTLIKDKLRRGDLTRADIEPAVKTAWTEAVETATQDKIMDVRADKLRKEIINSYLARSGQNLSGEKAMEAFRRIEGDYVRQLRKELVTAAGGEDELRVALKRRGQTMTEWENGLTRELFRREVLSMDLGPVNVSPSNVKAYYEKHPELFRQEDAWRLRRIRIPKSKFSSADVAKQAADVVKKKATDGIDFADMAAKVSDDPEFAKQGGMLTKEGKADMPSGTFPEEEKIAAALKDGDVSDATDKGDYFLLVQRVGYRAAIVQTFEQASQRAEALAFNEKLRARKRELFEKLKGASLVEVLQKDPPARIMKAAKGESGEQGDFVAPEK
jgi:hypothetical protein